MENKILEQERKFIPNQRTSNIVKILLDIVDVNNSHNKKMAVSCGLALDIEAASRRGDNFLTRNHGDLDIHPLVEDIPFWKKWFEERGYIISNDDRDIDMSKAFVVFPKTYNPEEWNTDPDSYYIDVYGLESDDKGVIHSLESWKDESWGSTWDENFIKCRWMDRDITVMKHDVALANKRKTAKEKGTNLRAIDLHDHKLFNIDPLQFNQD